MDLTCNARDADHAEQLAKAVDHLDGAEIRKVSDHNLTFLHSTDPAPEAVLAQRAASVLGEGGWRELLAAVRPACRTDAQAASVQVGGPMEHTATRFTTSVAR